MSDSKLSPKRTSLPLAFHARTYQLPVKGQDLPENGLAFSSGPGRSACWWNRNTSSWRTWQRCLVEGWTRWQQPWPKAGTIWNGQLFPRRTVEPPIGAIAGGGWPTPTVQDASNDGGPSQFLRDTIPLNARVRIGDRANPGKLNPDWVERLMGIDPGYTLPEGPPVDTILDPERWRDGSWEEGIPRLTQVKDGRRARLKMLGNAVVPQCVAHLGEMIAIHHRIGQLPF